MEATRSAPPQVTPGGTDKGFSNDLSQGVNRLNLSPDQLTRLAEKVATLLRFTLRIERERQG